MPSTSENPFIIGDTPGDWVLRQAVDLAATNVHVAMSFMQHMRPAQYLLRHRNYLVAFNYVYERARTTIPYFKTNIVRDYTWPASYQYCTRTLRKVVNRWIREERTRKSKAQCLILIGPHQNGKTTLAKSLPGQYNHIQNRWRLDMWNSAADYLIFDDVIWDEFEDLGYPSKKSFFTQAGSVNVGIDSETVVTINVTQPAVVLITEGQAEGSLTAEPTDAMQAGRADYWSKRAIVYRMGPDECFQRA